MGNFTILARFLHVFCHGQFYNLGTILACILSWAKSGRTVNPYSTITGYVIFFNPALPPPIIIQHFSDYSLNCLT